MSVHLFIGAIIALIMLHFGIQNGVILAIVLSIYFHCKQLKYNDSENARQKNILQQIMKVEIERTSTTILGTFNGNDVYDFIMLKNPVTGAYTKYEYYGIIQYNKRGQIVVAPKPNEVFTKEGLIYKLTPA